MPPGGAEFRGSGTCACSRAQGKQATSRSCSEARHSVVRERHTVEERREDGSRVTVLSEAASRPASSRFFPQPIHPPDQSEKAAA